MKKRILLTPVYICAFMLFVFAASDGIFKDLIEITESASVEKREWLDKRILLEKKARIALENGDDDEFVRLQKQILSIDRKIRELKNSALRKLYREINRGIVIPVEQEHYHDAFVAESCRLKESSWKPSESPIVTLEAEVLLRGRLSSDSRTFHMALLSQDGEIVAGTFFHVPVGIGGSNTEEGMTVKLYANPGIFDLHNVDRGVFRRER